MPNLHPAVINIIKGDGARSIGIGGGLGGGFGGGIGGGDRGISTEVGCVIRFERSILQGMNDKQLFDFFVTTVGPEICSNYFTARDAYSGNAPRGGSVSCSASTSGGGSVSCSGTWSW